MIIRFFVYGIIGWCLEIIWTGLGSLMKREFKLLANTSIWMFFIYGSAVFLEPICDFLEPYPLAVRGSAYMVCIFLIEYLAGGALKKADICPWDYSESKYSIQSVIRLDYAPVWFAAGLIFESLYRFFV